MRKYKRVIARNNMIKEGIQKFNQKRWRVNKYGFNEQIPSFFAENWRNYVNVQKGVVE